jgi:hypothetical protein
MTNGDKEALARRAVVAWQKCGLDWMPGMGVNVVTATGHHPEHDGFYVSAHQSQWLCLARPNGGFVRAYARSECLPDIDHAGTLGCLEHGMLPAAWGPDCAIEVHRTKDDHRVTVFDSTGSVWSSGWLPGSVPAKGLVLCLEAAAERRERC